MSFSLYNKWKTHQPTTHFHFGTTLMLTTPHWFMALADGPFKFLGSTITFRNTAAENSELLEDLLITKLHNIDKCSISTPDTFGQVGPGRKENTSSCGYSFQPEGLQTSAYFIHTCWGWSQPLRSTLRVMQAITRIWWSEVTLWSEKLWMSLLPDRRFGQENT